jgi:hypothetical protein
MIRKYHKCFPQFRKRKLWKAVNQPFEGEVSVDCVIEPGQPIFCVPQALTQTAITNTTTRRARILTKKGRLLMLKKI